MVKHHVHSTYSLLNLNGLAGDIVWFAENYPECSVSRLIVKDGDYCPHYAPAEYLDWLEEKWSKVEMSDDAMLKLDSQRHKLFKKEEYNHKRWARFKEKIVALDKYYNSKLEDYNPELAEFIEEG